jgi:imidazole glycerol phosphate synthase glutamine amidotransferase subunit
MTLGIVDIGIAGNIFNIQKAIKKAGADTKIVKYVDDFKAIDKLVLPGVGSFNSVMSVMDSSGLSQSVKEYAKEHDILGICLGMQMLSRIGFEHGEHSGLGFIDAEVKKIELKAPIPHMGFNTLDIQKNSKLLKGIECEEFYFMHSYEMINYTDILSLSSYAEHSFVSAIERDNIYGVQFHPEKSRDVGIKLFENFIRL